MFSREGGKLMKKKLFAQILAGLLALLMIVGLLPMIASAEEIQVVETGDNSLDNLVLHKTVRLEDDGTYTITTDYIDEGIATQTDNGEAIIMTGSGNDSTVTIIELVSANNMPTVNFRMNSDSSLVRVNKNGAPVSKDPSHKLNIKK